VKPQERAWECDGKDVFGHSDSCLLNPVSSHPAPYPIRKILCYPAAFDFALRQDRSGSREHYLPLHS